MQKSKINISGIITLIALLAIVYFLRDCSVKHKNNTESKITKSDTVIKPYYIDRWYPYLVEVTKPVDSVPYPVPADVDTAAILRMFFTEYTYADTIKDTNLIAISEIKVAENRVKQHKFTYKLIRPVLIEKIITNTVEAPKKGFFLIGLEAGINKNLVASFGPEALYVSKNKTAYGLGFDLLNKTYSAKFYIPIKKQ